MGRPVKTLEKKLAEIPREPQEKFEEKDLYHTVFDNYSKTSLKEWLETIIELISEFEANGFSEMEETDIDLLLS